jgi:hypothetical protein
VNAEFNVWLLIVGLVVGAGLVWVVMMDGRRREADIDAVELPREAAWLSALLAEDGYHVSPEAAEQALLLHRAYLGAPPPDPVPEPSGGDDRSWTDQEVPLTTGEDSDPVTDRTRAPTADAGPAMDAEPAPDASGVRRDES